MDEELVHKEEVFKVVGCAFEVLNTLGHGLHEKPYENALVVEMRLQGIEVDQQKRFSVVYKDVKVGEFVPDLIVFDKVIVDLKTIDKIGCHERGKMLNYLRITGYKVGLIMNFKNRNLEWERIVL